MSASVDPVRYPRLAAYISSLPKGLASYPECTGVTEAHLRFVTPHLDALNDALLPTDLLQLERGVSALPPWLPEVVWGGIYALLRDRVFKTDEEMRAQFLENNLAIFRGPLYRALFMVLSPSLVFAGATNRWAAFHRGSQLSGARNKDGVRELALRYPPNLFAPHFCDAMMVGFRGAVQAAGAKNIEVSMVEWTSTQSRFHISWT